MSRTAGRIISLVCASAPLAFGVLRFITTGTDFRYVVVALVSLVTVATVFFSSASAAGGAGRWRRAFGATVAGTLLAAAAALALGAASVPAIAVVAFCFTLCFIPAGAFGLFDRRR
jgi:hypothetical protein